jgi:hypothetical protein
MRPISVFANGPGSEIEKLEADLRGSGGRAPGGDGPAVAARVPPSQIAGCWTAIPRPHAAGSGGSAEKGWRGWPVGPGPDGQRWAGAGDEPDRGLCRPAQRVHSRPCPGAGTTGRRQTAASAPHAVQRILARDRNPEMAAGLTPANAVIVSALLGHLTMS